MPTLVACLRRSVEAIQPRRVPTRFSPATRLRRRKSQRDQGPLATSQARMCPRTANSGLAELQRPLAHGLVADGDAARGQQLLDHPQAEREAEVEPDGVADDLRREAVAGVGGPDRLRHARPVAGAPPARNLPRANLTVPVGWLERLMGHEDA